MLPSSGFWANFIEDWDTAVEDLPEEQDPLTDEERQRATSNPNRRGQNEANLPINIDEACVRSGAAARRVWTNLDGDFWWPIDFGFVVVVSVNQQGQLVVHRLEEDPGF